MQVRPAGGGGTNLWRRLGFFLGGGGFLFLFMIIWLIVCGSCACAYDANSVWVFTREAGWQQGVINIITLTCKFVWEKIIIIGLYYIYDVHPCFFLFTCLYQKYQLKLCFGEKRDHQSTHELVLEMEYRQLSVYLSAHACEFSFESRIRESL
jgi:hypothetical protein